VNIDERNNIRFLARDDAFAALGFSTVGKVKDISMGGLAFEYLNISENSDQLSSHKDRGDLISRLISRVSGRACKI